ncbi:hypothetical protein PMAYCL1PPCAC_15962 [Pristionchus mayeri]|uniref:Uncharacterized protein n=1 Tax=Pristionchus mayeri TaxID=1317129 RepID=A0AAN5CJV3_9BILA|nr:hypothetical protein PMAYCL1PPCAC_15962 [Pristionchus mayeri]
MPKKSKKKQTTPMIMHAGSRACVVSERMIDCCRQRSATLLCNKSVGEWWLATVRLRPLTRPMGKAAYSFTLSITGCRSRSQRARQRLSYCGQHFTRSEHPPNSCDCHSDSIVHAIVRGLPDEHCDCRRCSSHRERCSRAQHFTWH